MTSLTDTGRAAATSEGGKYDWLKAHIGSLAIASAMIFAASVWGYVNSAAFAVFLMGFVAFLIFFGIGVAFFAPGGGALNALFGIGFVIFSFVLLFAGISGASSEINKIQPTAALTSSPSS